MSPLELKPTHKPIQNYYSALRQFDDPGVTHETAARAAASPIPSARKAGLRTLAPHLHSAGTMQCRNAQNE